MIYNVLLIKNRFTEKFDYKKSIQWITNNTPVTVQITEIATDFDVVPEFVHNATFKGAVVSEEIYPKLRSVAPRGVYHAVALVYGNDMNEIRVSYTSDNPLYPETEVLQVVNTSDRGLTFNHELFHTFFKRAWRQGILLVDPMDVCTVDGMTRAYYNDKDLDADPSNRSIALKRLEPYWKQICDIKPMPTYKYFSGSEIAKWKLSPALWQILDDSRALAGVPFQITSGFRTAEENKKVGGKPTSSHLTGNGVDILCTDNFKRLTMIRGILSCGRPVFLEIAAAHLHIDIQSSIHQLGQCIVQADDQ